MQFDAKYLPHLCAAKEKRRERLCFVRYDYERRRLVASDGIALVVVPFVAHPEDVEHDILIPVEAFKRARRLCAKNAALVTLRIGSDAAWATDGSAYAYPRGDVRTPELYALEYVDYNAIMPTFKSGQPHTTSLALDPMALARLAEALGAQDGVVLTFMRDDVDTLRVVPNRTLTGRQGDIAEGVLATQRFKPEVTK